MHRWLFFFFKIAISAEWFILTVQAVPELLCFNCSELDLCLRAVTKSILTSCFLRQPVSSLIRGLYNEHEGSFAKWPALCLMVFENEWPSSFHSPSVFWAFHLFMHQCFLTDYSFKEGHWVCCMRPKLWNNSSNDQIQIFIVLVVLLVGWTWSITSF